MDDLVERDGLYYEKFTDAPYSGKVTGKEQGSFKDGKREGAWIYYHRNGQLQLKGNYKNGQKEGAWVDYWENGQLQLKGNYKNGKKDGVWVAYFSKGNAWKKLSGTFKDDVKISD